MKTIQCIAVDDEPLALEFIADYCEKIDYLELKGKFTNPFEAMNILRKERIDLVFLDIQMPDLSGFSLLKSMKNPPMTVFTTAYKRYALDSYELNAIDYLLKPFSFERFYIAVEKVIDRMSSISVARENKDIEYKLDFIFVSQNNKTIKILIDDIIFIKSYGDYIIIYTENNKYIVREKLKNICNKLCHHSFIRVHKSYVISVKKIDEIYGNIIKSKDFEIPIGSLYRSTLITEIERNKIG